MNALALFGASFSVPLFATFVRSEKARNELTIVASFAAIGMLVSVLALIDDAGKTPAVLLAGDTAILMRPFGAAFKD